MGASSGLGLGVGCTQPLLINDPPMLEASITITSGRLEPPMPLRRWLSLAIN